jgi:hypothetical protein
MPLALTEMQRLLMGVMLDCAAEKGYQLVLVPINMFIQRVLALKHGDDFQLRHGMVEHLLPYMTIARHISDHPLHKMETRDDMLYVGIRLDAAVDGKPVYSQDKWTRSREKELEHGMQ